MPELSRLQPVKLRDYWPNEARDFTRWLVKEENLAILSEALNMELKPEESEKPVGRYKADIVCQDAISDSDTTSWVLIENQLELTDHTHLGQLLTYAAGLRAVAIVWLARGFTEEHRAALDWLNEITDQRFRFFGVEVELWRIEDSKAAPKFNIVSKPNDWTRMTQRIQRGIVSDTEYLRSRFWSDLGRHMIEVNHQLTVNLPHDGYQIKFPIGRTGFRLLAWVSMERERRIAVKLRISSNGAFQSLREQQSEIEAQVGQPLEWNENPGSSRAYIVLYHPDADPTDESNWPGQHQWMASTLQLFYDSFRQRVQQI